jgi:glucose-6-phosphate 1-dehydrogenase
MSSEIQPTILVIVGITGDLSARKLLPAIEKIVAAQAAPEKFKVLGITRRDVSVSEVLGNVTGQTEYLQKNLEMYRMDLNSAADYAKLKKHLAAMASAFDQPAQTLFYLSIPPQISQPIIGFLGSSGIAKSLDTKLLLEKPFGTDLESAEELVRHVKTYFEEDQIYRIDHYLAKEMTQNLAVFRQSNSLFKYSWNKDFIESIEIVAAESIDIEGRVEFYEHTGALRDLVQSHLLQLTALVLADLSTQDWQAIPKERLAALRQILTPTDIDKNAVRGQYAGYRAEVGNPDSLVETFVSIRLASKDPRWEGVPITLMTGKALPQKTTEIRIRYKQAHAEEANTLIMHIQPNEGVEVDLWAKQPGYDRKLQKFSLAFSYSNHFADLPEAYERVFLDAMRCDHSLFTTSDEVLETWRILNPVQHHWAMSDDIMQYEKGTLPDKTLHA